MQRLVAHNERFDMDLHGKIMNIPVDSLKVLEALNCRLPQTAYKFGHRDARHAAAEMTLAADSERDELLTVARMIDAHYSASLDHQPAYVKLARAVLARAAG